MRECKKCKEELLNISTSHTINDGVVFQLRYKIEAYFYTCENKSCEEYGRVIVMSSCPDHLEGHIFIQCDEYGATCTCGKTMD